MSNKRLHEAKKAGQDEFYTQREDINAEMEYYIEHFKDKVIYCNCDDPKISNFYFYFKNNFDRLGIKKLVTTCYKNQNPELFSEHKDETAVSIKFSGGGGGVLTEDKLKGDGDFRSKESIELLKEADIVVTNPPFSLFREYIAQLVGYDKKFLIVGNFNAISYREVFGLIKNNKLWLGNKPTGQDMLFDVPKEIADYLLKKKKEGSSYRIVNGDVKARAPAVWFTNLDIDKRHEEFIPYIEYKEHKDKYPKYDNYDAIEVPEIKEIPEDYKGVMGVPITFLDKYNPEQFEIIGQMATTKIDDLNHGYPYVNGKKKYARLLIKWK